MAIALVQTNYNGNGGDGAPGGVTLPAPATAGNLLIIIYGNRTETAPHWSHSGFTRLYSSADFGTTPRSHEVHGKVAAGGEQVFTWQEPSHPASMIVAEFSGMLGDLAAVDFATDTHPDGSITFTFGTADATGAGQLVLLVIWKSVANSSATVTGYSLFGDTGDAGFGNRHRLLAWWKETTGAGTYGGETTSSFGVSESYGTSSIGIITSGAELIADFSGTPLSGTAPLAVAFTPAPVGGTGIYTYYEWDFGDGSTSFDSNPVHVYSAPGTYTVTLRVDDSSAATDSETKVDYVVVGAADTPSTADSEVWLDFLNNGFDDGSAPTGSTSNPMPRALAQAASSLNDNITLDVISLKWSRGMAADQQGGTTAGTLTCVVKNVDGKYTPRNTGSAYAAALRPGRRFWYGMASNTGDYKGMFAGYLRTVNPLPRIGRCELVIDDPFGYWAKRPCRVAFSASRSAKQFRAAILDSIGLAGNQRILRAEEDALTVSGADAQSVTNVLSELNRATGSEHFILPAPDKDVHFYYATRNRYQNLGNDTPGLSLDEDDIANHSGWQMDWRTIYNAVNVRPTAAIFTGAVEDVWTFNEQFVMDASTPKSLTAEFGGWVRNPVVTVLALGGPVTATLTNYGRTADIQLVAATGAQVDQVLVRGNLAQADPGQGAVRLADTSSQAAHGSAQAPDIASAYLTSASQGEAVGTAFLVRRSAPRDRPKIDIKDRFDKVMLADIGDPIMVSVAEQYVSNLRCEIIGHEGQVDMGDKRHTFGWRLLELPLQADTTFFRLNSSQLDGPDVVGV